MRVRLKYGPKSQKERKMIAKEQKKKKERRKLVAKGRKKIEERKIKIWA